MLSSDKRAMLGDISSSYDWTPRKYSLMGKTAHNLHGHRIGVHRCILSFLGANIFLEK
jgi:hypothetical protein